MNELDGQLPLFELEQDEQPAPREPEVTDVSRQHGRTPDPVSYDALPAWVEKRINESVNQLNETFGDALPDGARFEYDVQPNMRTMINMSARGRVIE